MPVSRRLLLAAAATGLVGLPGCTAAPQWRPIASDAEPQALATIDGETWVGTAGPGLRGPRGPVPVRPATDYGREAGWCSLAGAAGRLVGIGRTHGGAHSNARWSVFDGDARAGLTEREQPFDVFHGWGAGTLTAAAFAGGTPVLLGSWQSDTAGLDVVRWLPAGDRWARQPSTGTPLAATRDSMPQLHAACGGERLLAVGQVIELAPLRTRAVAWTCTDPRQDWTRIDLPHDSADATARAVAVLPDGWLVAGRDGGALAAWTVGHDLTVHRLDLPGQSAGDAVHAAAAADGRQLIVAGTDAGVRAFHGRPGDWQASVPPGDTPVAAAWATEPTVIIASRLQPNRLLGLS